MKYLIIITFLLTLDFEMLIIQEYSYFEVEVILELTKEQDEIYLSFPDPTIKDKTSEVLLTNLDLHWNYFPDLSEEDFLSELKTILKKNKIPCSLKSRDFNKYTIDKTKSSELDGLSVSDIYMKFYDDNGFLKEESKTDIDLLRTAVNILVKAGNYVYPGPNSMYQVTFSSD